MTESEIEFFEQKSGIKDNPNYVLHRGFTLDSLPERYEHYEALDEFRRESKRKIDVLYESPCPVIAKLKECINIAEKIQGRRRVVFDESTERFVPEEYIAAAETPPVESAHAESPTPILAARKKTKKESTPDGKTTFRAILEDESIVDDSPENMNVVNTEPIPVRDNGVARNMLWALTMHDHPDEKIRHWAKSESGVGHVAIAKSENPDWASQYGETQADEMWASEGERIRMQVRSVNTMLEKRNNPTKPKKAK